MRVVLVSLAALLIAATAFAASENSITAVRASREAAHQAVLSAEATLASAKAAEAKAIAAQSSVEQEAPKEEPKEEPKTGAVVASAPVGVPVPSSGWHVAYADAFGSAEDHTYVAGEGGQGCCGNSNEVAVERKAQVTVGPEGLELACVLGTFTVEGRTHSASCGGVKTDSSFEFNYATSGEWAVECYCRWPVDTGGADPGFWVYTGTQEIDFFEGWGWDGSSWATADGGMPVVVGKTDHHISPVDSALGFDPSQGFHRYTTVYNSGVFSEYIDGALRWSFNATAANTQDGLILTNALREHTQANVFTIRSVAFYQDGAHAGQGIKGGGIAPGTTVK